LFGVRFSSPRFSPSRPSLQQKAEILGQRVTEQGATLGAAFDRVERLVDSRFTNFQRRELLAALEDARDVLAESDHLAVLAQVEHQIVELGRKLGFDQSGGENGS
jgi:DnaJ-domain-containing protein 1